MPGSSERAFVILAIDDTALNLAVVKARGVQKVRRVQTNWLDRES